MKVNITNHGIWTSDRDLTTLWENNIIFWLMKIELIQCQLRNSYWTKLYCLKFLYLCGNWSTIKFLKKDNLVRRRIVSPCSLELVGVYVWSWEIGEYWTFILGVWVLRQYLDSCPSMVGDFLCYFECYYCSYPPIMCPILLVKRLVNVSNRPTNDLSYLKRKKSTDFRQKRI